MKLGSEINIGFDEFLQKLHLTVDSTLIKTSSIY